MTQKDLTKTFMMISFWKNPLVYIKNISVLYYGIRCSLIWQDRVVISGRCQLITLRVLVTMMRPRDVGPTLCQRRDVSMRPPPPGSRDADHGAMAIDHDARRGWVAVYIELGDCCDDADDAGQRWADASGSLVTLGLKRVWKYAASLVSLSSGWGGGGG